MMNKGKINKNQSFQKLDAKDLKAIKGGAGNRRGGFAVGGFNSSS